MERINPFKAIYCRMNTDDDLPPKFPYIVDVELTNKCNLSCNFCSRQFMKREQGFMDEYTFGRILNDCFSFKPGIRFIRWGEPLLHPKIFAFAGYIKKVKIPLHITTNGLLLNEEKCKKIVDIGIDSIIFSMQGLTKEDYEIDRNNKKYEVLLKNVKYLHKIRRNSEKPYITINSTYTESRDASYESHPPSTSIDYINDFKEFWFQYADDVKVGKTNWARIDNSIGQHIDCKEPWQKLSVDWDGEVSACCGDYDRLMNIGNINEQSLYQLWDNNYILDSYRNLITNGKHNSLSLCSKCYPAHGNIWEKK